MFFMVILRKLKTFVLIILGLLKRCFCCFRKRRISETALPVSVSGLNSENSQAVYAEQDDGNTSGWDSWDGPSSVVSDGATHDRFSHCSTSLSPLQQQIQEFRHNQQKKLSEPPAEPSPGPDYFQDLAPKIKKKPQVIILARPEEEQQVSNRLSSLSDPILEQSADLEEWNESDKGGWEEEAEKEVDFNSVLREQRHLERQQRKLEQLKRKAEKEMGRGSKPALPKLATKIS